TPQDVLRHVDYLCRPELEGRLTGSDGEQLATSYVAAYFDSLGLQPAGDTGSWFQSFDFTSGVDLGEDNKLTLGDRSYRVQEDWLPLAFSATGDVPATEMVFAGYGISAPAEEGHPEYDSFVHLDVKDKWVVLFRYMPEGISAEYRQHLSRFTSLRFKAMLARDKGARGLVVVSGPNSHVEKQLIPLRFDGSLSGSSLPVVTVTDAVCAEWVAAAGKDLRQIQDTLDRGEMVMGFSLGDRKLAASIEINKIQQTGRNVLGVLRVADQPTSQVVLVGAHVDHLGRGNSSSSLARDEEADQIHVGADDNASGVAGMLEIAQYLSQLQKDGRLRAQRDILFAAWSGEELGLLGSSHFAKNLVPVIPHGHAEHGHAEQRPHAAVANPHTTAGAKNPHTVSGTDGDESSPANPHSTHDASAGGNRLYPYIAACLNLDMVGRLDKQLVLQGIGSSSVWKGLIEQANVRIGLPITLQNDSYLPTDASVFFLRGVPILSAFTGSHSEYHTPRDTPDRLNYEGAAQTARLMALVARAVSMETQPPDYIPQEQSEQPRRAQMRAYLGTIPDYAESDAKGVKLSGVQNGGPAAQAGVKGGDMIIELAGRK
ncbi:MAG: M28 family peptidase, partial [Planctomycetales bacterium]|nr:M28 family peptidase [Planctomycetales bacterium]